MSETTNGHLDTWNRKRVLRTVYNDFYERIAAACAPGLTIELGGGVGNLKQRLTQALVTDIQFRRSLDCVADAQCLPFANAIATNIVMVDVLHHLEFPVLFFREAERVLKPGGSIIMVEPAITVGSTLFYRLLHHEPVRKRADPFIEGSPNPKRDPYDANQAIPTLFATRDRDRFHHLFPNLNIARVDWFSFAAYPLSGGFKRWSLITQWLAHKALQLEHALEPIMGRFAAFRLMMIVEKKSH